MGCHLLLGLSLVKKWRVPHDTDEVAHGTGRAKCSLPLSRNLPLIDLWVVCAEVLSVDRKCSVSTGNGAIVALHDNRKTSDEGPEDSLHNFCQQRPGKSQCSQSSTDFTIQLEGLFVG